MSPDDFPGLHRDMRKRIALAEAQNWRCAYCWIVMKCEADPDDDDALTVDEVVARAAGGTRIWSNQIAACWKCNNGRGSAPAERYAEIVLLHGRARAPKIMRREFRGGKKRRRRHLVAMVLDAEVTASIVVEASKAHAHIRAPHIGVVGAPPGVGDAHPE